MAGRENPGHLGAAGNWQEPGILRQGWRTCRRDVRKYSSLRHGDIVTAINGQKVANTTELRNRIAETSPGEDVKLQVFREGKVQDVGIKLGEQPEDLSVASNRRGRG